MNAEPPIRASDTERDEIAKRIQAATAEGRLTLEEADERLTGVFASKYQHELATFVADLPSEELARPAARGAAPRDRAGADAGVEHRANIAVAIHAAIVVVISVFLISTWARGDSSFFWPAFPMFWLFMSLLGNMRGRRSRRTGGPNRR
ncbi:DUF1707 SHOCT-like domain-containing protein [Actinopolymorpha pittospori]|uniref:DUF1707 domain-containing protein n=1 Tax=Actinopolymorpha pittospori TaxID=648752 RepID=A0A927MUR0_9ACTN|nr:DUF1707 domain-containing protein [Actinopolymorpha pittospori]MBE1606731.1 hypothetical protein [Actinopolymorpha pittospori]